MEVTEGVLLEWDPRFPVANHIIENLPQEMFWKENQIFIREGTGAATVPKCPPTLGQRVIKKENKEGGKTENDTSTTASWDKAFARTTMKRMSRSQ